MRNLHLEICNLQPAQLATRNYELLASASTSLTLLATILS